MAKELVFDNLKNICFGQRRTIITKEDDGSFDVTAYSVSNYPEVGLYKISNQKVNSAKAGEIMKRELVEDLGITSDPQL